MTDVWEWLTFYFKRVMLVYGFGVLAGILAVKGRQYRDATRSNSK